MRIRSSWSNLDFLKGRVCPNSRRLNRGKVCVVLSLSSSTKTHEVDARMRIPENGFWEEADQQHLLFRKIVQVLNV